jgi:hypothetical protein
MELQQELTAKYKPALDAMAQQNIQVTSISLQGNKLYVEAYAPTQEAKNAAWDRIKAIDSSYADLTCDINVGSAPNDATELHGAPASSIASGLAAAFRSDSTPEFGSMLANLFNNSDGQQRAGLLNQILSSAGPSLLGAALPASLTSILKGGSVTPEQAEQISPDAVKDLAQHAEKGNPSIVDQVSNFYSQHPRVVQALGAGALAMIMNQMRKS